MAGMLMAGLGAVLAEVLTLKEAAGGKPAEEASHLTLTWLVGIGMLAALVAIGFKKSKRTHLD